MRKTVITALSLIAISIIPFDSQAEGCKTVCCQTIVTETPCGDKKVCRKTTQACTCCSEKAPNKCNAVCCREIPTTKCCKRIQGECVSECAGPSSSECFCCSSKSKNQCKNGISCKSVCPEVCNDKGCHPGPCHQECSCA